MSWTAGLESYVRQQEPLAPRTWLRLGGPAEFFAEPNNPDELAAVVRRAHENGVSMRLLGGGSNVLVSDSGVKGVVIHLSAEAFAGIGTSGSTVTAGGGAKLGQVVSAAAGAGLAGLEALVGIPGTVGGALRTNAGGRTGDIGQFTRQATVMTPAGELVSRGRSELVFAYRESSLDELVILSAEFQLEEEDPGELTRRMQKLWILKKAEQPLAHQPCGCIFKSPRGLSAAALVEQAGLGGTRIGGAEVCNRNANFIVADASATARDVSRLIDLMRSRVSERLGVDLELEIEVWQP
jgi:UDP-N-acetylmuramate dehydrogenase